MDNVQYLADGHHVDEAGNLICCTYVDLRPAAERLSVGALKKASSERRAIPGCETIRISRPSCFNDQGEGFTAGIAVAAAEVESGGNAWVYCAFIAPETPEQETARRAAMPGKYDAVSPIHRPREFARALAAMVAEQAGPQGRTMLLRSTAGGQVFRTAHRSQTLYHGPVVYADDLYRRLESASSALEFALLRIFMKPAVHRGQREYRFAAWTHGESGPDRVDLDVSPALVDAMQRRPIESEGGGLASAVLGEPDAVEEVDHRSPSGVHVLVEAPPGRPAIVPPRYGVEGLPGDLRETVAVGAAVEALRAAVGQLNAEFSRDAAAAAWHAESVVRFVCSTYAGTIAAVRVNEDSFIVIRADVPGDDVIDVTIAVGPDGTCACRVSTAHGDRAFASPDIRSLEEVLTSRLAEAGVQARGGNAGG